MKSADGTARNSDEAKRKNLPGKDRPRAVHEAREGWHENLRSNQQDAGSKRKNGPGLDKGAQVVARREQEPNGQGGSRKAVDNDGERERHSAQRECVRPGRRIRYPLPRDDGEENERDAHDRSFKDAAGAN